jgi:hypothetical protein
MMEYNTLGVMLRTVRCRLFGRADIVRWADVASFDQDWEERMRLVAELVPKGTRVIEFGAGNRKLQSYLDPSCSYVASDLVERGADTVVLDLSSRPLPDLAPVNVDVAVFAGVIEYITDLHSFVRWLADQVEICVASYECAHSRSLTLSRIRETVQRLGAGWVNTFTEAEFVEIFRSAGFALVETRDWHSADGDERIFVFRTLASEGRIVTGERLGP